MNVATPTAARYGPGWIDPNRAPTTINNTKRQTTPTITTAAKFVREDLPAATFGRVALIVLFACQRHAPAAGRSIRPL